MGGLRASIAALLAVAACHAAPPEPSPSSPGTARASSAVPPAAPPGAPSPVPVAPDRSWMLPAADRVVAIGDIHGDLAAARRALRLAGAVDASDRWIGGPLVVVQTGDEIDRGKDDRAVIELFDRLADEAEGRGGKVVALVGNHEAMNVAGDFRYVTEAGLSSFGDVDTSRVPSGILAQFPAEQRGRVAAFFPGGPFARRLSARRAVVAVGETVFVHGGVTAEHARYGVGRFNREVQRWMKGEGTAPDLVTDPEGPLWTRRYSDDSAKIDCEGLAAALALLSAKRLVVGHTPHKEGVSPACDGAVWRIDTGLSSFYGGETQVLEIRGGATQVLKAGARAAP